MGHDDQGLARPAHEPVQGLHDRPPRIQIEVAGRLVGQEYLDLCRGHARLGEREVFPHAREVLTAEDWDRIRAEITSATDPLFGDIVDQSYQHLYDMIERAH